MRTTNEWQKDFQTASGGSTNSGIPVRSTLVRLPRPSGKSAYKVRHARAHHITAIHLKRHRRPEAAFGGLWGAQIAAEGPFPQLLPPHVVAGAVPALGEYWQRVLRCHDPASAWRRRVGPPALPALSGRRGHLWRHRSVLLAD